ncbi:MAG: hypothetical protein RR054_06290 [Clostridia bacterium]
MNELKELYSFDEIKQLKRRHKMLYILYFALLFVVVTLIIILTLLHSEQNHNLLLTLNCLISVIFVWFTIFFFSIFVKPNTKRIKFLSNILNSNRKDENGRIVAITTSSSTVRGNAYFSITLLCNENQADAFERIINWETQKNKVIKTNTFVKLQTVDNVVVAYLFENQ